MKKLRIELTGREITAILDALADYMADAGGPEYGYAGDARRDICAQIETEKREARELLENFN